MRRMLTVQQCARLLLSVSSSQLAELSLVSLRQLQQRSRGVALDTAVTAGELTLRSSCRYLKLLCRLCPSCMSSGPLTHTLRDSTESDVAGITSLYTQYVQHHIATFETEPPSPSEMQQRRQEALAAGGCHLVALAADGALIGFAYAGLYKPRAAYRFTLETSVYLQPDCTGRGVGTALLQEVAARCRAGACQQLVAIIAVDGQEGAASVALHRKLGFRLVGRLTRVGFKFGRWLDTAIMQADLTH